MNQEPCANDERAALYMIRVPKLAMQTELMQ